MGGRAPRGGRGTRSLAALLVSLAIAGCGHGPPTEGPAWEVLEFLGWQKVPPGRFEIWQFQDRAVWLILGWDGEAFQCRIGQSVYRSVGLKNGPLVTSGQ